MKSKSELGWRSVNTRKNKKKNEPSKCNRSVSSVNNAKLPKSCKGRKKLDLQQRLKKKPQEMLPIMREMRRKKKMSLKMKVISKMLKKVTIRKNPSKKLQRKRNADRGEKARREELVKGRKAPMVNRLVVEVVNVEERVEAKKAVNREKRCGGRSRVKKKPKNLRMPMKKMVRRKNLMIKKSRVLEKTMKPKIKLITWLSKFLTSKRLNKMRKKKMMLKMRKKRKQLLNLLKILKLKINQLNSRLVSILK